MHNLNNMHIEYNKNITLKNIFSLINMKIKYNYVNGKEILNLIHRNWFLRENKLISYLNNISSFANNILDIYKRTLNLKDC